MSNNNTDSLFSADDDILVALGVEGDDTAIEGDVKAAGTVALHPLSVEDVFTYILKLGEEYGVTARAEGLVEELRERTDIILHKLKFVEDRPIVACIAALAPPELAGGVVPELITIAGGRPADGLSGMAEADIILVAVPGYSIERTIREIGSLLQTEGWSEMKAVINNQVYIADGEKYFFRRSPAMIDSLEILAEIIQPKQFIFGFQGDAWVKFEV